MQKKDHALSFSLNDVVKLDPFLAVRFDQRQNLFLVMLIQDERMECRVVELERLNQINLEMPPFLVVEGISADRTAANDVFVIA